MTDDKSSHFSGVIDPTTEDDIKYGNMKISTDTHERYVRAFEERDLDKITNYDIDGLFKKEMTGEFVGLDKDREAHRVDRLT